MILSLQTFLIVRMILHLLITLKFSPEPTNLHLISPKPTNLGRDLVCFYVGIFLPLIQMLYQLYMFKPEYVVFKHFWQNKARHLYIYVYINLLYMIVCMCRNGISPCDTLNM